MLDKGKVYFVKVIYIPRERLLKIHVNLSDNLGNLSTFSL